MPSNHLILCHPLLFPSSNESFPMSQFFTSGGQSIGASASAPVQDHSGVVEDWLPLVLTVLNVYTISIIIDWYRNIDWQGSGCDRCTKRGGGCDQRTKRGREELPHVWGQGQKPGGPHSRRVAAKRSYPTSEIRGSGRECQAETAQERPRRATQVQGQGRWLGGATPHPRSGDKGIAAGRSYPTPQAREGGGRTRPTSKEPWLNVRRRA